MTVAGHEIDIITPTDHLSPPSTTSRLSDSDTSECDIDGLNAGRDGASISSLGSSSSPPPEVVAFEQNSVLCVCVRTCNPWKRLSKCFIHKFLPFRFLNFFVNLLNCINSFSFYRRAILSTTTTTTTTKNLLFFYEWNNR